MSQKNCRVGIHTLNLEKVKKNTRSFTTFCRFRDKYINYFTQIDIKMQNYILKYKKYNFKKLEINNFLVQKLSSKG